MTSIDGGVTYADAGATALPAVMGRTVTVLAAGDPYLIDHINNVDVQLVHPGLTLSDADDDALLAGANLAMINNEAVQYGRATPLGAGRWRLSQLWRGRRGTEWATAAHSADAPFLLIEAVSLARLNVSASVAGTKVMAVSVGDATGVVVNGPAEIGASVRPLCPVGVTSKPLGGDVLIAWTRRSRDGWRWRDLVDAPIGEENERYRVTKIAAGRADVVVETVAAQWTYTAAERAADFAAGAIVAAISVVQIGALSVSKPANTSVPTN